MSRHEFDGPGYWSESEFALWGDVSRGYDMQTDMFAARLFSAGWIEEAPTPEMRQAVRDAFFDYAIEHDWFGDREDFDWHAWREYMGY